MIKARGKSISKFEDNVLNEDSFSILQNRIAVSDGAGGGGVFAERWSSFLTSHLPFEPIADFTSFDKWIDGIWEGFYNEQEKDAKKIGGLFLNKFYDEGSFATLVAAWGEGPTINWIVYGDSVIFRYGRKTGELRSSFQKYSDFAKAPSLINWKDPCDSSALKIGKFDIDDDSVILLASDTLSQFIIMMYLYCNGGREELLEVANGYSKMSNQVKCILASNFAIDFYSNVLNPLCRSVCYGYFPSYLKKLYLSGFLGYDDYTLVVMGESIFTIHIPPSSCQG